MSVYHKSFNPKLKRRVAQCFSGRCVFCGDLIKKRLQTHHVYDNKQQDLNEKTRLSYVVPLCWTDHNITRFSERECLEKIFVWFIEDMCKGIYQSDTPIPFVPIAKEIYGKDTIVTSSGEIIIISDGIKELARGHQSNFDGKEDVICGKIMFNRHWKPM